MHLLHGVVLFRRVCCVIYLRHTSIPIFCNIPKQMDFTGSCNYLNLLLVAGSPFNNLLALILPWSFVFITQFPALSCAKSLIYRGHVKGILMSIKSLYCISCFVPIHWSMPTSSSWQMFNLICVMEFCTKPSNTITGWI